MTSCNVCGSMILFGGKKEGNYRFCNNTCLAKGKVFLVSDQISHDVVEKETKALHKGSCPKCGNHGPVDVHLSYRVWSALLFTSWKTTVNICCKRCGVKAQALDLTLSSLFGWWGVPWGIFITPIQIVKNVIGMSKAKNPLAPSPALRNQVRLLIAANYLENEK